MTKRFITLTATACLAFAGQAVGQNIAGHYVSKAEEDGMIYHLLPTTLFENRKSGDLTFDITYKSGAGRPATINFTYEMKEMAAADSICFAAGPVLMKGPVEKIYLSAEKKSWKHRYTFSVEVKELQGFFNRNVEPQVTLYSQGRSFVFEAKSAAWKSYAPIGYKIMEMIRINER